ncbi:hypothetical protein [Mycolicibacterium sp. YH-1]|uniref:hypothetical protein n=1 Tax=Mycolicibacterium sp. YH-1 TaxID=2908837 RepID=UPI001F4C1EF2|nr:hypothetical protein [Mycolicibacterium sp. YH-1]UNB54757.1 hypothetical protein L0M16_10805 [Mycolicibacterium sp. YH-1]
MTARSAVSPVRVVAGDIFFPALERYRLHVIAPRVVGVVASVGGWLFDRAMAGWEVTVLLASTGEDPLPIHILGGEVVALETGPQREWYRTSPDALAVAADLCSRDNRIREKVQLALDRGRSEVALWGQSWPDELDSIAQVETVEYRLSVAARAFKARALAAAAWPVAPAPAIEVIRTNRTAIVSTRTTFPPRTPSSQRSP